MSVFYIDLQYFTVASRNLAFPNNWIVLSDAQSHTINYSRIEWSRLACRAMTRYRDVCLDLFNLPASLTVYKNSIFICELNIQSVQIITSLTAEVKCIWMGQFTVCQHF